MAGFEGLPHDLSFPAGADLSAKQYNFVKLNTSGQVILAAAITDNVIGVLQNAPTATQAALVRLYGVTKVVLNATLTAGTVVSSDANGKAIAAAATSVEVGTLLSGGNASEQAALFLQHRGVQ